ncbi:V-set and transmembrane domain-containing protein 2-like protein [Brachyhypopomus gauderio]|uniref:V-set and transmembrane domain-containing protein 2-like protein n=1 Tax=Brachyhypopomus gauderio TaxID=698409 RepID=UPI0040436138
MEPFGALLWISHYMGLFVQLNAASQAKGLTNVVDHGSGNALFTEVPHDIVTQSGQDVEMACSFRGAGSTSVSLEIQWWYLRHHREWAEKPAWTTNQVVSNEDVPRDATKISVVKVAGSNISHRLRLSSVKPADEGTYECRVIDFSDNQARHHKVRAYLQVQPPAPGVKLSEEVQDLPAGGYQLHTQEHDLHYGSHHSHKGYGELREGETLEKEQQELHGDYRQHQKDHHRGRHSGRGDEGEKAPSAVHHGEHYQRTPQNLHEEDYLQVNKQTQAWKKGQAKSHQSEARGSKGHDTENANDCSTDGCVL